MSRSPDCLRAQARGELTTGKREVLMASLSVNVTVSNVECNVNCVDQGGGRRYLFDGQPKKDVIEY